MSFDWLDYIRLADDLVKHDGEAYTRTAISRAYYGVFCVSRNKAGLKNYRKSNVHWEVIKHYKNSTDPKEKFVGNTLDKIRIVRNKVDYDEDRVDAESAIRILLKSKRILKNLGIKL